MSVLFRAGRRVYQVAADLPNVLGRCHLKRGAYFSSKTNSKFSHLVLDTVFPVVGRRELIPDNHEAQWMCADNSYLMTIVMPPAMQPLKLIIPPALEEEAGIKF